MHVETCTRESLDDWVRMRRALWPEASLSIHRAEAEAMLDGGRAAIRLARSPDAEWIGFAEATLRHDYVNGCETSPVAFLEGLYVRSDWRRRGVARLLVRSVVAWATAQGCRELASDALIDNQVSQRMHMALGFEETERVVYYRRSLGQPE
ncbi:aminoglycoside 6'-N-acetyltransferase [Azospirillum sp.]|uniref:aminoglycoside 6'-N-acetyltransferase n=1 Tax=Azospirillum sp. TaxID=34012 RepID=UPI003D74AD26